MANRDITIAELPATIVANDDSFIPIDNGDITYKIKVSDYNAGANATARAYAEAAFTSATNASTSAGNAATYADNASQSAQDAGSSAALALEHKNNASLYANSAYEYAAAASTSASNATSQAQQVSDYAREATESSEDAEAFAVGQRGGVDVDEEDITHENNAKYYAELAASNKRSSDTAVNNSLANARMAEGFASGKQDGSAVPSGSEYYHNNAKYFSDLASGSANDAVVAADRAENAVVKTPYVGNNNHWYAYDFSQEQYVDTGVKATGDSGAPGQKGDPGVDGITPTITAAASVSNTSGTPSVTVTKTGSNTNPSFAFNFSGLKGDKGEDGERYDDTEIKAEINDTWEAQGQLGAKNLIKYPYYGTTRSYEGLEFTDSNGIITINGVSTVSANYYLRYNEPIYLKKGSYILSVETPLGNNARIQLVYKNGSGEQILASITRDAVSKEFVLTDDIISNAEYWYIRIVILANAQVDNLVVAPMIRLASDADNTWQPYALTNRELTERVTTLNNSNIRNVLTVGSGSGYNYASLTDAVIAASEATNTDVYIANGTYDIYAEFIDKYGANYFNANDFTSQPNYEGLPLNNGVNLYFASGAKVVCELPMSSTSEAAQQFFSAFKLNGTDAGLYNLDLYCKNTRYSIHDEASGQGSYHHVYKDCRIEQARDQGSFGYENCIGGGCGLHGRIDIENCHFKGAVANGYSLSWHNGSQSGAQNYIYISNSYFEQGKIRFRYYGVSDLISRMTVSGCSMPYDIDEPSPETSTSLIVNTEVIKWNNVIRT